MSVPRRHRIKLSDQELEAVRKARREQLGYWSIGLKLPLNLADQVYELKSRGDFSSVRATLLFAVLQGLTLINSGIDLEHVQHDREGVVAIAGASLAECLRQPGDPVDYQAAVQ